MTAELANLKTDSLAMIDNVDFFRVLVAAFLTTAIWWVAVERSHLHFASPLLNCLMQMILFSLPSLATWRWLTRTSNSDRVLWFGLLVVPCALSGALVGSIL
jgi:hypothetical protein